MIFYMIVLWLSTDPKGPRFSITRSAALPADWHGLQRAATLVPTDFQRGRIVTLAMSSS